MLHSIQQVLNRWRVQISRLRVEEFLAALFFVPMVFVTTKAYVVLAAAGGKVPRRIEGDMLRIVVTVLIFLMFVTLLRRWKFLRETLPFAFCIAIYTNLHDTIHFVNPNDVQHKLIAIDQWLFGAQPCVWAERFINPTLTDIFTFTYSLFFLYEPLVALVLYVRGDHSRFRHTMLSVVLGFYIGYFLYILFPAAPPRVVLQHQFTVDLHGQLLEGTRQLINVAASESRGAFPSLHAAGTLIALICAFRYQRWLFWVMLPFGAGLIVGTVYLRHHYVVDLMAGALLAPVAVWIGARADGWWSRVARNLIRPRAAPAEASTSPSAP